VYARITVNGAAREFSTGQRWSEERWDQQVCRATSGRADSKKLNSYLDLVTSNVIDAKRRLMERNSEITAAAIREMLFGGTGGGRTVLGVFAGHNRKMSELEGIEYAARTVQRYVTTFNHTGAFIKWKFAADDISLGSVDYGFVCDYEFWLRSVRKCSHNSTMKYLSNFKKIVTQCLKRGWIDRDPFASFRFSNREVERVFLDGAEISRLSEKRFSIERLSLVRDIFLFSCYTGLSYADVKLLKRPQIAQGIDGEQWISVRRQKTGAPSRLPLLPQAMEIVRRYQEHERCPADGPVLPVFSNQKMNAYLKEIAAVCGIDRELTFHAARHTFATTVTLTNGVPIETVSRMLGHKSIKHTQHYARIVDLKVSADMKALKSKLAGT